MPTGDVAVIGGGAAGFFAAITYQERHPTERVIIIEKSARCLQKVAISGGGRCNVTHACDDPNVLAQRYPRGHKALIGPFYRFNPQHTIAWFEEQGVALKTEADGRVFPISNCSASIVNALEQRAAALGVRCWTGCGVRAVEKETNGFVLTLTAGEPLQVKKVILATGGSRGGHALAQSLGHRIVAPVPSLFSFTVSEPAWCTMQGLAVPKVGVWLAGKKKQATYGPLLVTHWGMSGPAIITLSAWQARVLHEMAYRGSFYIDFLCDYTPAQCLDQLHDIARQYPQKRCLSQSPFPMVPKRLWQYVLARLTWDTKVWKQCNKRDYTILIAALKQCAFLLEGKGQFKDEFVTCGGVGLDEVNFKTMESRICPGLYLVGELLDCDGLTGGFNFQHAWTSGYIAGSHG